MTLESNDDATPSPAPPKRDPQANNPLHGITLEVMVKRLVDYYGWRALGQMVPVRCFLFDPTITSSLKFLRRTEWARKKVENLYLGIHEVG